MEKKDTILNPLDYLGTGLQKLLSKQSEITWEAAFKAGYHQREIDPLDKEDRCEKCYEQGIKEVVGWMKENNIKLFEPAKMGGNQLVREVRWQAKLKEWGLKEG